MFSLLEPTEGQVRFILAGQQSLGFSYAEVGASRSKLPRNYRSDHNRICVGHGSSTFARAAEALRRWQMFEIPGVHLCWPSTPIEPGNAVAIVAKHCGIWSLNCCRIVYVVDEGRRYGFAYGTLPEHSICGEERFTVEWDCPSSDSVWYELLAFSRPSNSLVRTAYPLARLFQRRFVHESISAMVRVVTNQHV
jgi:uncharacterized protein (UPF0548 family)